MLMKSLSRLINSLCMAAVLLSGSLSAFAEVRLPDGTVAGLPEKLTVLDSDGNAANSDTGEYFFEVEDMQPDTKYTKKVQIMNLREDKAYHIYFYAEPISNEGEIDLESECEAVFSLDGSEIFRGSVSGQPQDGYSDISKEPLDLGLFEPGDSKKLTASVIWNGGEDGVVDYGSKLVDVNGTHILREESGTEQISGETKFRWIFYAVVDEDYTPPNTGVFSGENRIYIILLAVAAVLIIAMIILIMRKKKKQGKAVSA